MNKILAKIISIVLTAASWLYFGVRGMLDLIGYSTIPDDVKVAGQRLDQFVLWLMTIPTWIVFGIAVLLTGWLIWYSWGTPQITAPALNPLPGPEPDDAPLIAVTGRFFARETVTLDGHSFVKCVFEECRLVYNGGKFGLDRNEFRSFSFESANQSITNALGLLHSLDLLKLPVRDREGRWIEPGGLAEQAEPAHRDG